MPSLPTVHPDQPRNPVLHTRIVTLATITGAVAVTLFFATEAIAGAFAMVWAVSGLMHLAATPTLVLHGLALALAVTATAKVALLAWAAETDPANSPGELRVHGNDTLHDANRDAGRS